MRADVFMTVVPVTLYAQACEYINTAIQPNQDYNTMSTPKEDQVNKPKVVTGLKGSVATFVRLRDNKRIYVFARRGESKDNAVKRVMSANGSEGGAYDWTN
jgi:hypothetical protein